MTAEIGVLLVAHGTPDSLDAIPAFLQNIRRGRPTPPVVVDAVRQRYEAIGGRSPLLETTREQANKLGKKTGLPCEVAMRMWHPMLEQVLRDLAESHAYEKLIVVSAAPHSAHIYSAAVRQVAEQLKEDGLRVPSLHDGPCWGAQPAYINAWAAATARVIDRIGVRKSARAVLVASAHSLPMRTVQAGDPYPKLVAESADAVVSRLGRSALPSLLAFQSQGMTPDPWLGPDLPTAFERAATTGAEGVVVVPVGFPAEHVETLYDLDIEAKAIAEDLGLWFERVPCLDAADGLVDALAAVVEFVRADLC